MGQTWRRLLFAHWSLAPEAIRPLIPHVLPVDLYEGRAWVGVTPFRVEGVRLRHTLPPPFVSHFLELNVRTYVTLGGRPGIFFFSLDASSRLAVAAARRTYRLPYFRAVMSMDEDGDSIRFRSRRASSEPPVAELDISYRPTGERFRAQPGSLEHWLTERYYLYTLAPDGSVLRGEIHHAPWSLRSATAAIELNTMTSPLRLDVAGEPLLHFAERQDVVVWKIEPARESVDSPSSGSSSPWSGCTSHAPVPPRGL
jgi:uncharacterized protein